MLKFIHGNSQVETDFEYIPQTLTKLYVIVLSLNALVRIYPNRFSGLIFVQGFLVKQSTSTTTGFDRSESREL